MVLEKQVFRLTWLKIQPETQCGQRGRPESPTLLKTGHDRITHLFWLPQPGRETCQALHEAFVGWWVSESRSVVSHFLRPHGLYSPGNSPGQNTREGSLSLLQGIFPTQELNWGLLHCRWVLYQLSQKGSPQILEWVAYPFSSRSSQLRNRTGVLCIAGGFFTSWAIGEKHLFNAGMKCQPGEAGVCVSAGVSEAHCMKPGWYTGSQMDHNARHTLVRGQLAHPNAFLAWDGLAGLASGSLGPNSSTLGSTVQAVGVSSSGGHRTNREETRSPQGLLLLTRMPSTLVHTGLPWRDNIRYIWETVLYNQDAHFMLMRVKTCCGLVVTWFERRKSEAVTKWLRRTLWLENPN